MKTECTGCGLPTEVDDYGFCNRCHDEAEHSADYVAARRDLDREIYRRSDTEDTRPQFYACGICGSYHSIEWDADCRNDADRFSPFTLDELYGAEGWEEMEMPV